MNDEAIARARGDDAFTVWIELEHADNVDAVFKINRDTDWFAMSAATGEAVAAKCEGAAIAGHKDKLISGVNFFGEVQAVAVFEFGAIKVNAVAFHPAYPAHRGEDNGNRLFRHGSFQRSVNIYDRRDFELRAAMAEV